MIFVLLTGEGYLSDALANRASFLQRQLGIIGLIMISYVPSPLTHVTRVFLLGDDKHQKGTCVLHRFVAAARMLFDITRRSINPT